MAILNDDNNNNNKYQILIIYLIVKWISNLKVTGDHDFWATKVINFTFL